MKSRFLIALTVILTIASNPLLAQSSVEISPPELELRDNRIVISYRILRSSDNDKFRIWVEATDDNGKDLHATSLSGDVGSGVSGGGLKQISWNYENDGVSIDNGVGIQVFGELFIPVMSDPVADYGSKKTISKPGAILRSVAFPGLGLTAMTGKPHWLKGVAGYGAIASAVIFNNMAYSNYNSYLDSNDITEISDYFETAVNQGKISNISVYAAIGIWITDIAWTLLSDPGSKSMGSAERAEGLNFGTGFEPNFRVPMVALRYNF